MKTMISVVNPEVKGKKGSSLTILHIWCKKCNNVNGSQIIGLWRGPDNIVCYKDTHCTHSYSTEYIQGFQYVMVTFISNCLHYSNDFLLYGTFLVFCPSNLPVFPTCNLTGVNESFISQGEIFHCRGRGYNKDQNTLVPKHLGLETFNWNYTVIA